MAATQSEKTCPHCAAPLPPAAPEGICPQCELQGALDLLADPAPAPAGLTGAAETAEPPAAGTPGWSGLQLGDYELVEEIARGGMGVVYRARQRSLGRIVAVKMLLSGPLASREFIQRFRTEAAATASLQHPHIVAIHEVGFQAGQHYFAMDFVAGRTLADLIATQPLPAQRAAIYLKTVAEAVHFAHEHGILHRDLKPSNVIIDANDQPRITDFGLAKRVTGDTEATMSAQTLGSPNYMPPEQAATGRGKVSRRSDVYALGAMLYHALTGRPPFVGGTLAETLRALLDTELVRPRLLNPAVPLDLETICLKCLEKESARRYRSAQELADELGRWLRGEPILARPIGRTARCWRWCHRKPALAALGAAVLLLLVVITVGSTVAALSLKEKEQSLRSALHGAYLSEAHIRRQSGQVGQRFKSLDALASAAAIRPTLGLRNEAIAALALPDLRELDRFEAEPGSGMMFDARLATSAEWQAADKGSGKIVIRRVADRRELARVPLLGANTLVLLSPNGRFLAQLVSGQAAENRMEVWDVAENMQAFETVSPARGFPVDFHPDGRRAAFAQPGGQILLVDLVTRREERAIEAGFAANRLRFHPDGRQLAAAKLFEPEVVVFDLTDGATAARLPQPGGVFTGLDWSAGGEQLAVACSTRDGANLVQVWEWRGGKPKPTQALRGHQAAIVRVAFVPESDLLWSVAWDNTTRLWSGSTGRQLLVTPWTLAQDTIATNRVAFDRTGGTFALVELVSGHEYCLLPGPPAGAGATSVDFSPDGRMVASAGPDGVRLWHAPTGRALGRLPVGPSVSAVFDGRDGSLLVAAGEKVSRWPVRSTADGERIIGPAEALTEAKARGTDFRLALSGDGTKLAYTSGASVEVIDGNRPLSPIVLRHDASQVALSPDGAWAVTSGGGRFKFWRTDRGEMDAESPAGGYATAAFSPDGQWLVLSRYTPGSQDGLHRLCRVGTWETVREFKGGNIGAFSPDGRVLALRSSATGVRLLDTRDWSELATFDAPDQQLICGLDFSPNSTWLGVACESRLVQVWDLRAVRQSLAKLGLDWDQPPYGRASAESAVVPRLVVKP